MSNIFQETVVTWSPMPRYLCKSGLVTALSSRALRLYLVLLDKASRLGCPVVFMTRKDEEDAANVLPRDLTRTRTELSEARLIVFKRSKRGHEYELLQPGTGARIPKRVKIEELSAEQIAETLQHLGMQHYDDVLKSGTSLYICPFHPLESSKSKRKYLGVNAERGVWQCYSKDCRRNGKRRLAPITNTRALLNQGADFGLESESELNPHRLRFLGGGNILDLIVAVAEERGILLNRETAAERLRSFLATGAPMLSTERRTVD